MGVESRKRLLTISPFLKGFGLSHRKGLLFSFVLGFLVRLIPEALSFPYPIGFDTIDYAARMKNGIVWYQPRDFFSTWLLYSILTPLYGVVGGDPFLLLKFVAPLLYALNVCGVYYFARRALDWDVKGCLMAAFFFSFQLAALRMAWDLYRNMLGMAILLFALPWIKNLDSKRSFAWFVLLSLLVVFGHEIAAVIMFASVLGAIVKAFLKNDKGKMLRVSAAISPAATLFLITVTGAYRLIFPVQVRVETNIISAVQPYERPGGLFFLVNYLNVASPVHNYATYLDLAFSVFLLFVVLYLLCLPLVLAGFFRDGILDGWTLFLLIGSFSCLIVPFSALDFWDRWMLMLVYPFTFYAVSGVGKVLRSSGSVAPDVSWLKWIKVSRRMMLVLLLCMGLLGSLFMTVRFGNGGGVFYIPATISYFPTTMLHNTVPLQDVEGVIDAMNWLNGHMPNGSAVLVQHPFLSWARLYLGDRNMIVYFVRDVEEALSVALEHGFRPIFLVWWGQDIGWHNLSNPVNGTNAFSSGRISVFSINLD